jgi:hypothetical protein
MRQKSASDEIVIARTEQEVTTDACCHFRFFVKRVK